MKRLKITTASLLTAMLVAGGTSAWASSPSQALVGSSGLPLMEISTYAGTGAFGEQNGDGSKATFRSPQSILLMKDGTVLISDSQSQLIRKIAQRSVSSWAGNSLLRSGINMPQGALVDGKSDQSSFQEPDGLAADAEGNVYVADAENNAIRKISADGTVTTVAGDGTIGSKDGKGKEALFYHPQDIAIAMDGTIYVADTLNHLIRKIALDGTVTTLNAPSTRVIQFVPGDAEPTGDYLDGDLKDAKFNEPAGLALDDKGNLYVSDAGNQRIRYIDFKTGKVTTVAGGSAASGSSIYGTNELYAQGDFVDGAALSARFNYPRGLALTSEGGLVIADSMNNAVRYLFDGQVTTLAGNMDGLNGYSDGIEGSAGLHKPTDVAVQADGSILVADAYNNRIRLISSYRLPSSIENDGKIKVVYNHSEITFDALPEMVKYRTLVPVRAIAESVGYLVEYSDDGTQVRLIKGDMTIELTYGSTDITVKTNGKKDVVQKMDVAPFVKESRTYVPVRFFAEQIGLDVQWDQATQTVILRDKTN